MAKCSGKRRKRRHRGRNRASRRRSALARIFVKPILRRINYQALARSIITVEPMPQGALPIYYLTPKTLRTLRRGNHKPPRVL